MTSKLKFTPFWRWSLDVEAGRPSTLAAASAAPNTGVSSARHSPHVPYRADIDGLRAVAVLLVVGYHAVPARFPGGFIGVDIFFVISGFLISSIILGECAEGTFSVLNFYVRRCRRIIPALLVVLFATWIIGGFTLISLDYSKLAKHLIAGATFTSNLLLWGEAGYFDVRAEYKPLLHLWSLGVEEQYYIIWPLLLAFLYRRGRFTFIVTTVCLLIASFALEVSLIHTSPASSFYLLPCRFWELLIGAFLAYLRQVRGDLLWGGDQATGNSIPAALLAGAGLALIAASCELITNKLPYPGWLAIIPVAAASALIVAGPQNLFSRTLLCNRTAVLIGLISYPIYLWHWPLISFFHIVDAASPFSQSAQHWILRGAAALSIVLAYATWRWIEKPVQRWSRKQARDTPKKVQTLTWSGAALGCIAALGLATLAGDGLPMRHPTANIEHFDTILADTSKDFLPENRSDFAHCQGDLAVANDLRWCYQSKLGKPTIALWGDSLASAQFPALAQILTDDNLALLAEAGCAPLRDVISRNVTDFASRCLAANRQVLQLLSRERSIRTVILISRGPLYLSGSGFGPTDAQQWTLEFAPNVARKSTNFHDIYLSGVDGAIQSLEDSGKQVVFVLEPAELDFTPQQCLYAPPYHPHAQLRSSCYIAKSVVMRRQSEYRALVAQLQLRHPKLKVFDAAAPLCDAERCYAIRDGHANYYDSHHVSNYGAGIIGRKLGKFLSFGANPHHAATFVPSEPH
ncbi:MAG TPA: acyltransferase family protein [Steroidobacteraceae bacterium]